MVLRAAVFNNSPGFYPVCCFVIDLYQKGLDEMSARKESFREYWEEVLRRTSMHKKISFKACGKEEKKCTCFQILLE